MLRRAEFPAAWSSLATIDAQLGDSVHHFLLLNDDPEPRLVDQLKARPHTTLLTPGSNLGVAVGRNTLIKAALEWGANILISLDDDLLVPSDYVERISRFISERVAAGEKVGIVAPAILDFHAAAEQTMTPAEVENAENGRLESFWSTAELRRRLAEAWPDDVPVEAMYHAGICEWRYHYLESYRSRAARLRSLYLNSRGIKAPTVDTNEMRLRPEVRKAILTGDGSPAPIDTAAGGACAYTSELLSEIGGLDEAFSPFGYEDSDFSIRALEAGFQNFSLTSEILLHDLDSRQKTRSPAILLHTQGRARALIARKHIPQRERVGAMTEIAALAPLQAVDLVGATGGHFPSRAGGVVGSIVAYMGGFVEGLFATPTEPDVAGSGLLQDYRSVPHRMERPLRINHRSWWGTPVTGLPRDIVFHGELSYQWNPDQAKLTLHRLHLDAPGQIRIKLSAEIDRVGLRDSLGNPDPLSCRINRASISVEDWGFLNRLQSTIAWYRKERSPGYFSSLMRSPSSRVALAIQAFLSLRSDPAHLEIAIDPPQPVSVAELYELTPGVNLERRLGLSIMVKETVRY